MRSFEMITSAKYTDNGSIIAKIDGVDFIVPNDDANRHMQLISAWISQGNTIEPFVEHIDLYAHAALRRWEKETGGMMIGDLTIFTDDRSKMMIMGARIKAQSDPEFVTKWKTASGGFEEIDAPTIIAVSDAVLAHVDACFSLESDVIAAISTGAITAPDEIDAIFSEA
jgi:hypothetical protein